MTKRKQADGDVATLENGNDLSKPKETKAERFARLANQRMPKLLKRLKQIEALANRSQYEWTAEQSNKLLDTLVSSLDTIQRKFQGAAVVDEKWSL